MSLYRIETHQQLDPGLSQEWLLTNGSGSYASSTVVGCNTRRYHGLLCAATLPPVGRILALSRVGEILRIGNDTHELSVNCFANVIHPRGDQYLKHFSLGETADFEFDVAGVRVIKQVHLAWKQNLVAIRYTISPPKNQTVTFDMLPFVALRDFHSLRRGTDAMFNVQSDAKQMSVGDEHHSLHLRTDAGNFVEHRDWWTGHFYPIEAERGQDCTEDLFTPGKFTLEISKPTTFTIFAAMEKIEAFDWDQSIRDIKANKTDAKGSQTLRKLHRAANDFVVDRKKPDGTPGTTVMAGYPWFADWGRDTMISLPGLFLSTGRLTQARDVLCVFAEYVSQGMIPNRFDDYTNEPSYNTVDASLWFIHACYEYRNASKDNQTFEKKLLPACRAIIEGYSKGTRYFIRMEDDGLITQGDASTQLTWMDAKCNNVTFTPRQGKAVEINALWYNALKLTGDETLAEKVRLSFVKTFWISPFRGLCDVVSPEFRDEKIRPNQIFAVSLPHSPLDANQQAAVVEIVRQELLTPVGLRTLAQSDPQFHDSYTGDQFHRDGAYHNGTIWPWLIGAFLDAYLKVNKNSPQAIAQAKQWLSPLIDAMNTQGCIGSIAEIHEAKPPQRPVGCGAQAWSVAEVLRLATRLKM